MNTFAGHFLLMELFKESDVYIITIHTYVYFLLVSPPLSHLDCCFLCMFMHVCACMFFSIHLDVIFFCFCGFECFCMILHAACLYFCSVYQMCDWWGVARDHAGMLAQSTMRERVNQWNQLSPWGLWQPVCHHLLCQLLHVVCLSGMCKEQKNVFN